MQFKYLRYNQLRVVINNNIICQLGFPLLGELVRFTFFNLGPAQFVPLHYALYTHFKRRAYQYYLVAVFIGIAFEDQRRFLNYIRRISLTGNPIVKSAEGSRMYN